MRWALALAACWASLAHAEPAWRVGRAPTPEGTAVEAFVGVRSVGAGFSVARGDGEALALEAAWLFSDRVLELRGARSFGLLGAPGGSATLSANAGVTGLLVPQDELDLGVGSHAGLTLTLGARAVSFQLGATTGVELFARGSARFVERFTAGLSARLGRFRGGLTARAGVDLAPGKNFTVRADAIVFAGWQL